jgi:hypothetical protein
MFDDPSFNSQQFQLTVKRNLAVLLFFQNDTEKCKLGFNLTILFEKSLIFEAMLEFTEIKGLPQFQKHLEPFSRHHP